MAKVCKFLIEDISFTPISVVPCGSIVWETNENVEKYFIKVDLNDQSIDFDYYFDKRKTYIEQFLNGEIPNFCKNCEKYTPIDFDLTNTKFKKINIYNRTQCNCRCIYCCLADYGNLESFKKLNERESYDIKPILQKMDELNLLEEGVEIAIFGGECTLYPDELKYIIDWGQKYNAKFTILSNGIIYNNDIEKLLINGIVELRFSLDAGSKELFEKIKRTKVYDIVHSNIIKYKKVSEKNNSAKIQLRYILCPEINTSIKEIDKFLTFAEKINVSNVVLSIDRQWMQLNCRKKVPFSLKKSIKYFLNSPKYEKLSRSVDSCEMWDWWLNQILNEKTFFEKVKGIFIGK